MDRRISISKENMDKLIKLGIKNRKQFINELLKEKLGLGEPKEEQFNNIIIIGQKSTKRKIKIININFPNKKIIFTSIKKKEYTFKLSEIDYLKIDDYVIFKRKKRILYP